MLHLLTGLDAGETLSFDDQGPLSVLVGGLAAGHAFVEAIRHFARVSSRRNPVASVQVPYTSSLGSSCVTGTASADLPVRMQVVGASGEHMFAIVLLSAH
jgi:hypothetical protein